MDSTPIDRLGGSGRAPHWCRPFGALMLTARRRLRRDPADTLPPTPGDATLNQADHTVEASPRTCHNPCAVSGGRSKGGPNRWRAIVYRMPPRTRSDRTPALVAELTYPGEHREAPNYFGPAAQAASETSWSGRPQQTTRWLAASAGRRRSRAHRHWRPAALRRRALPTADGRVVGVCCSAAVRASGPAPRRFPRREEACRRGP